MAAQGPIVSICIPAHNAERWVRQCVESALSQTWPLCEVIAVDDGSTDGTGDILASFGERIRLIRQQQQGSNPSRNAALKVARGDWVLFLDADDYLLPGKVEQQLHESDRLSNAHGSEPVAALIGPVLEEIWENGAPREPVRQAWFPEMDFAEQWLRWFLPQTSGVIWSRPALSALGGWKEGQPSCQEYECYLRLYQSRMEYRMTQHAGAVYRIWSQDSLCRKDPGGLIRTKTALMDNMLDWLAEHGRLKPGHQRAAGQACFEMARTLAQDSLETALAYAQERQRKGRWAVTGAAAPWKYRLAYRFLGMAGAEKLARTVRAS